MALQIYIASKVDDTIFIDAKNLKTILKSMQLIPPDEKLKISITEVTENVSPYFEMEIRLNPVVEHFYFDNLIEVFNALKNLDENCIPFYVPFKDLYTIKVVSYKKLELTNVPADFNNEISVHSYL